MAECYAADRVLRATPDGPRSAHDAVIDEGGERRLAQSLVLELDPLVEPVEQALSAAEDDRRDDDRQLLHDARREGLPDEVGSAHDVDDPVPSFLLCPSDRLVERPDEPELVPGGLLLGPVRD